MTTHTIHARGYLMILASSILFGTYGIWSVIMGDQFDVFFQGWVRCAIVLVILLPLVYFTKSYRKIRRQDWKWVLVTVGFAIFTQAPLYYAFNTTSIGTATLIFYSMFIITSYLMGRLFLGEKITKVKLAAIALAFLGLALVFGLSLAQFSLLGMLMAVLNGIASGGEVSSTKKTTDKYPSLLITTYVWVGIFISHLIMSLVMGETQWAPELSPAWLAMVAFAIAGLAAFWLVVEGFKFVEASIGSLIGLLEIIWGVIFGIVLFHEHAGPTVWLGAAIIILAGMLPDLANIIAGKKKKFPGVEPVREL